MGPVVRRWERLVQGSAGGAGGRLVGTVVPVVCRWSAGGDGGASGVGGPTVKPVV